MDYTDYICADGRVRVIRLDSNNDVTSIAKLYPSDVDAQIAAVAGSIALLASVAAQLDDTMNWNYANGQLTKLVPAVPAIGSLISAARSSVDQGAETARWGWLTPGAGQEFEYLATSTEATQALAAPDPLNAADYPFLAAGQSAHAAAGASLTLRQVAQEVITRYSACLNAAAAIKQIRLTAKLQIAAATTPAQINTILAGVVWPIPPA